MKLLKNMEHNVVIALEALFSHMNMKGLAFHVDITLSKEKTNLLKNNEKK